MKTFCTGESIRHWSSFDIIISQPDACLAEQLFHYGDAGGQVFAMRSLAERPTRIQGSVKIGKISSKDAVGVDSWLGLKILLQYFKERHENKGVKRVQFIRKSITATYGGVSSMRTKDYD